MEQPNSDISLPTWVLEAMRWEEPTWTESQDEWSRYRLLYSRIQANWETLVSGGLLKHIAQLSDRGKAIVFQGAVKGALCADETSWKALRSDVTGLKETSNEIMEKAAELATLLRKSADLRATYGLQDSQPSFFDVFESACEKHQEWAYVCERERRSFLSVARSQTRARPVLADMLEAFCALYDDPGRVDAPYPFNVAISSQKPGGHHGETASDQLRIFIQLTTEERYQPAHVCPGFCSKIPSAAIASMAKVMLEMKTLDAKRISGLRKRMKDESVDLDATESGRRFGIIRF